MRGWFISAWLVTSMGCSAVSHDDAAPQPERARSLADAPAKGSAFPCEVDAILAEYCQVCHGDPPLAAPFSLMRPEDFQGESHADPSKTMAVASRERVTAEQPGKRMPPPALGALDDEALRVLTDWLERGAPAGAGCRGDLDASTLDAGAIDDGGRG